MSTEFTVGLESTRNSSKVLKPPGGESSNIFGLGVGATTSETKAEVMSKEAVADLPPPKPTAFVAKKGQVRRNPITGEGYEIDVEKVEEKGVVDSNLSEKANEQTKIEPSKIIQTSIRVRNPPGGKSSGIF